MTSESGYAIVHDSKSVRTACDPGSQAGGPLGVVDAGGQALRGAGT